MLVSVLLFLSTGFAQNLRSEVNDRELHNVESGPSSTFSFTGAEQMYVVPERAFKLLITACGAQGGHYYRNGLGGCISCLVSSTPGSSLFVNVGGSPDPYGSAGGFNGGGSCIGTGQNGGGASDVRTNSSDLNSRLVVAGGGGGEGIEAGGKHPADLSPDSYSAYGLPSQSEGGGQNKGGTFNGAFGTGGDCLQEWIDNNHIYGGIYWMLTGAGGGGWYGGGAGLNGGGGGSSHCSDKIKLISQSPSVHSGDGSVVITPIIADRDTPHTQRNATEHDGRSINSVKPPRGGGSVGNGGDSTGTGTGGGGNI